MDRLYKKSELNFALVCIAAYVVLFSLADSASAALGVAKSVTAPAGAAMAALLFGFIKKNGLEEAYGLCPFAGGAKAYLYFIPLVLLASTNLWNGARLNLSVLESALFVATMLCVGFIEEVIFRGFLFKAMCRDNVRLAVLVSSLTFGMGHIVNLLNGQALAETLLQVCYACAVGFLFTVIFYRGKSLWPCIVTHGAINSLSGFAVDASPLADILSIVVLCVGSVLYALWILRKTKKAE